MLPATGKQPPARTTARPTGKPSWPFMLVAGREKTGKTWWALEASASPLIGRTFLIEIGEGQAHEYGSIPGADYEIVTHDGTYRDIYNAVWWAVSQEWTDGKPNLVIVDGGAVLWDLLISEAQEVANRRAEKKGRKGVEDVDISIDLWNVAKTRWKGITDQLRFYRGPSILTTRMEEVVVVVNGKPTTDKTWRIAGHKTLPFDVDAIIEWKEVRRPIVTGLRSVKCPVPEGGVDLRAVGDQNGTFHSLVTAMGLADVEVQDKVGATVNDASANSGADEIEAMETDAARPDEADPKRKAAQDFADKAMKVADQPGANPDDVAALLREAEHFALVGFPVTVSIGTGPLGGLLQHIIKQVTERQAPKPDGPSGGGQPAPAPEAPAPAATAEQSAPAVPAQQQAAAQTPVAETPAPAAPAQEQPPQQAAENARVAEATAKAEANGADAVKQRLFTEIMAQAQVHDVPPRQHMADLLPSSDADPRAIATSTLMAWVISARPGVVAKLRADGQTAVADQYEQFHSTNRPVDLGGMLAAVAPVPSVPEGRNGEAA